jgi:hypothetical protein
MPKKKKTPKDKKRRRKEAMEKIISKISDMMKEYARPSSERKNRSRAKKPSR